MNEAEFSRRIRLDEIGSTPRSHAIAATVDECAALVERFGLAGMDRLDADITVIGEAAGVRARGRVRAAVSQICVVSGQPIAATVDEIVDVLFAHAPGAEDETEEWEIGASDCDILPLEGEAVDIGELAAETVSLALEPYPRLSDDDLAEYRRLLISEEEAEARAKAAQEASNPFSVLKKS